MKPLTMFPWAAAVFLAALPAAQAQQLVPAQSNIFFVSRQMGVPVEGQFKRFDASIQFNPSQPQAARIAFNVDTGSATLGVRESDAELPKPTWFNVPAFPKATFQSTAVKRVDTTHFEVAGQLTIKGVTAPVVVPVTLAQAGAQTTVTGVFPIKRLTFKIGDKEWSDTSMVADEVQVKFKLALTGVGKL